MELKSRGKVLWRGKKSRRDGILLEVVNVSSGDEEREGSIKGLAEA